MKIYSYYLLVFILGSFIEFIVETIWCIYRNHKLESRKVLIYSPLIPIYGMACLIITFFINAFDIKNIIGKFILGIIISSVVEYISSWLQEKIFNTKSWDYTNMKYNISGRINLKYSFMFGFVALLWSELILNKINSLKIINNPIITIIITILLLLDIIISFIACYRMKERKNKIKRNNLFWKFIDKKYNDKRLEKVYANMQFI